MANATIAYELYEKGLYLDAARAIDRIPDPATDLLALRAILESHVGVARKAESMATSLLRQQLTSREQSLCWETIGRVNIIGGQVTEGMRAMSKAFETAVATQDPRRYARLIASYAQLLLHSVSEDAAIVEIPRLRQAAVRAGDEFSIIELHTLEAELKAKRGLLSAAMSSVETARELLQTFPNAKQQGRVLVVATAIALIQGDYNTSLNIGAEALSCARTTGARNLLIPALNNLAYIKMSLGKFDEVGPLLNEVLGLDLRGGSTEIAALDTQMLSALAQSDLDRAKELADAIVAMRAKQETRDRYYQLWHVPTRVRWLYRLGEIRDGLNLATETLDIAQRMRDLTLIARLHLLIADGQARIGSGADAAASLAKAINTALDPSIELLAEIRRVAGRIEANHDNVAAREHFEQARNFLASVRNLTAEAEVTREAEDLLGPAPDNRPANPHRAIPRFSNFVELGGHIPTLSNETMQLVIDCGLSWKCSLTAIEADGRRTQVRTYTDREFDSEQITGEVVRIHFGFHGKQQYELWCVPRPTGSARIGLLGIERLVTAALGLASFRRISREKSAYWPEPTTEHQLGLICSSERMLGLVKTIRRVATSNVTVLLTGETGVGKELFARALHLASPRNERIFLPFNCGTVPRDLLDSQLFGHRRGAFTGAHADSPGVIRSAAGGTLFLDEIGEMAIETQPKLLRFLESGEILPLGDTRQHTVDVRIVAATNANLDQMVAEGRFREDLYYRLNVIRIHIPPLRERREEIPALVEHFLERFGRELQKPLLRVADETLEYLVLYRWPGNVRQLSNEIRRMVALAEPNAVLMPAHLSDDIVASRRTIPADNPRRGASEVVTRIDQPLSAAIEHIERAAIQRALALTDGNLIEAAKLLGLSRKGLYLKRQRLNLG